MTDDEQKIEEAIARALETLSERLSRELSGAFNQMAHQIGRAQQQQLEIIDLVARQAEAISARAKVRTTTATNALALSSNYCRAG
jgi:DNA-binding transcriptional regulator GbsR (MarR family)